MNLISVYVAVGAISFVKCEFRYNSLTPFQSWQPNRISEGEWNQKFEKKFKEEMTEQSNMKPEEDSSEMTKMFSEGFQGIKHIFNECQTKINRRSRKLTRTKANSRLTELKVYVLSLYQCVKVLTLLSFDEILNEDLIPVTDFVYFVKDGVNITEDSPMERYSRTGRGLPLKDYAARVLGKEWTALAYDRVEELLRTHSLKFQMDKSLVPQGRGRRRDHRMFAMMVMGFMIMASILIPMGFQFLTVLGGKSLLLAKLALIMSAINGLKKIATSNVGYGFYHTGSEGHHHDHIHHGFHEKHYNPQNYNLQGYN